MFLAAHAFPVLLNVLQFLYQILALIIQLLLFYGHVWRVENNHVGFDWGSGLLKNKVVEEGGVDLLNVQIVVEIVFGGKVGSVHIDVDAYVYKGRFV